MKYKVLLGLFSELEVARKWSWEITAENTFIMLMKIMKNTCKGLILTSVESFAISELWWSIASTLFPQSPRKPVWNWVCMHKLELKKVLYLNTRRRLLKINQIALKYLHEEPLRGISRIFIIVVNKPVLHFFLLLDQFGELVCIVYNLHIAINIHLSQWRHKHNKITV